jgi:hypothetical protein
MESECRLFFFSYFFFFFGMLPGVYSSLYTARGIAERRFARIEAGSSMAVAVVLGYDSFSPVIGNSVVVTRITDAPRGALAGYTMATQVNNTLVTNPLPGTLAESTWATIGQPSEPVSLNTVRYATPVAGQPALTSRVLPDARMLDLVAVVQAAEIAYCNAIKGDKPGPDGKYPFTKLPCSYIAADKDKVFGLDMEFKHLENGQLVVKQIREFRG